MPDPAESDRLDRIVRFLEVIDRFKSIERAGYLADRSRRETDSDHAWHMALFALLLFRETQLDLDVGHLLELILTHDLVEIYAGDTFAYDYAAREAVKEREAAAADRLFAILPPDLGAAVRGWWEEFERGETPEAQFARSMDRLQAYAQNVFSGGQSWRERGVTEEMAHRLNAEAGAIDPAIGRLYSHLSDRAKREGAWGSRPEDGERPARGEPDRDPGREIR